MKLLVKSFSLFIFIVLLTGKLFAQDVQVQAEVDRNTVTLGDAIQFTLTLQGTQNLDPVQFPQIDGFDTRYLGPSRRISIVNGQYSSSVSFIYSLLATKVGKFNIPPFKVTVDQKELVTNPISVEVVDSDHALPTNQPAAAGQEINLKDRIFLELRVPKSDVYVNEKVPVKIILYVSNVSVSDIQYPQLETIGFTTSNYERPQQSRQNINGVPFDVVEFDTAIYPTRTGEIKLGPAKLECSIMVSSGQGNRSAGMFDDDFFNSFFDRAQRRPITISSKELTLNVKELPADEKPENFSGGVGNFTFDASVSPTDVKVGDPITLKMSVQGEGNLSAVSLPAMKESDAFKVYEPTVKEENGVKRLEQVLIPKKEAVTEVPAITFAYFNNELSKYQTVVKGPFSIKVSKGEDGAKVISPQEKKEEMVNAPESFGQDIVFIKEKPSRFLILNDRYYKHPTFYIFILIGFCLIGVLYVLYFKSHRLRTDQVFAKKYHAPRYAKNGLEEARKHLKEENASAFYDQLFKTLQIYLSHKFSLPIGEVYYERVQPFIKGKQSSHVSDTLRSIFDECDRIRYSSVPVAENDRKRILTEVEEIIDYLERQQS
jgi:hypothetical protein